MDFKVPADADSLPRQFYLDALADVDDIDDESVPAALDSKNIVISDFGANFEGGDIAYIVSCVLATDESKAADVASSMTEVHCEIDAGSDDNSDCKSDAVGEENQMVESDSDDTCDDEDISTCVHIQPKSIHELSDTEAEVETIQKRPLFLMPKEILPSDSIVFIGEIVSILRISGNCSSSTQNRYKVIVRSSEEEILKRGQVEEGSIVCLQDRTILGRILETFGPVIEPCYVINYPPLENEIEKEPLSSLDQLCIDYSDEDYNCPTIRDLPFATQSLIYCVVGKCRWLNASQVNQLLSSHGCDASNQFDEELKVGDGVDEDFSDDEKEKRGPNNGSKRRRKRRPRGGGNCNNDCSNNQINV